MEKYISIEEAKYIDGYRLYLKFNDGKENILDFKNLILLSQHPEILTAISKEKYYELLRINNMLQASFPLVFSMTSIWKLDNYA